MLYICLLLVFFASFSVLFVSYNMISRCACVELIFLQADMCAAATASNVQQKFSSLRRRLDQLGYRQPLGIESLPLVERLFADLIHTTESLKNSRLNTSSIVGSGRRADGDGSHVTSDAQIDAYKSDNARLIRENNELHQQLIHVKEDSEFTIKGKNRIVSNSCRCSCCF